MFRTAFRRLLAIDDPPERTALAFTIGIFIAFSPFLGLHTIMATVIAFAFRFNKVAIYTGTFINNPFLTLVPIIIASYAVGAFILGRPLHIPDEGIDAVPPDLVAAGTDTGSDRPVDETLSDSLAGGVPDERAGGGPGGAASGDADDGS